MKRRPPPGRMESQMPIAAGASAGSPRYPSLFPPPPAQQNGGSWAGPPALGTWSSSRCRPVDGELATGQPVRRWEWDIWWFYASARVLLSSVYILHNIPSFTENVP